MDKNYKYLLLDMDMTLLNFKKSEKYAFKEIMDSLGLTYTEDDYVRYSHTNDEFWKRLEKGLINRQQLLDGRFSEFAEEWGADPVRLNEMFINNLAKRSDWLPGAENFLKALHDSKKYPVYIATNGPVFAVMGRINASGLAQYADGIFISEALGASKPNPAFFEKIFEKVGDHDVSNYLMIGDRLSSDIKGANNIGMDCVLFAHDGNLPEDLRGCKADYFAGSYKELQDLLEVP